jgi:hypothetical protein
MDYEGQRLAEILYHLIICSFGAVGWVIGYINQDFYHTFYVWLVAVVISVIVSQFPYSKAFSYSYSNYQNFSLTFCRQYHRFAFQIGPSSIDTPSNGLNQFQIEDKSNKKYTD